eukprot:6179994-Pleurochrysis_carterae.AAC.1
MSANVRFGARSAARRRCHPAVRQQRPASPPSPPPGAAATTHPLAATRGQSRCPPAAGRRRLRERSVSFSSGSTCATLASLPAIERAASPPVHAAAVNKRRAHLRLCCQYELALAVREA